MDIFREISKRIGIDAKVLLGKYVKKTYGLPSGFSGTMYANSFKMAHYGTALKRLWWAYKGQDDPAFLVDRSKNFIDNFKANFGNLNELSGCTLEIQLLTEYQDRLYNEELGYYPLDQLGFGMTITEVQGVKLILPCLEAERARRAFVINKGFKKLTFDADQEPEESEQAVPNHIASVASKAISLGLMAHHNP